ncbi:DUF4041 domain-containing protein [Psychrosphaera aquimarina]|uniref:DUF4041 domain-containing protein n=1 Tax=Psychrosphaera aquimarina TaxID=2044854 RepID=A0ABU3QWG2_9GAMM|nr:DUF4041 domain-containing protein [Psychrosphaera aquimarina]MDU0111745.1 DUF4041 domain-containing protein [Psychrosphaera aquimarina]
MDIEIIQTIWTALFCLTLLLLIRIKSKTSQTAKLEKQIADKKASINSESIEARLERLINEQSDVRHKINIGKPTETKLKDAIKVTEDDLKMINVGLLPPVFNFDDCEMLKEAISECHVAQYDVIKQNNATVGYSDWTWMGDKSIGHRMVRQYRELLLRAFNAEYDFIRKQMRHSSYTTAVNKLQKLAEQLSKLGEAAKVEITDEYLDMKIEELTIWHSELVRKEELKAERKKQQALLRAQVKKGGDDTEELEDDIYYRKSDLNKVQKLARELHGASALDMEDKIAKMQKEIDVLESKFERATSQAQLTKMGYIYVISNIGSFGNGVVKIGMTRRLEPMDRVKELGDASVPFMFDVHTLTFVDNAPSIEKTLHRKFDKYRVNQENFRKEFFNVNPQEVAEAMVELGIEADWYFDIEAKEYRESLLIREARNKQVTKAPKTSTQLPDSI